MTDQECLEQFETYLANVKKSSANTLASYMRDVRQLSDYLSTHKGDTLDTAGENALGEYVAWLKNSGKSVATVSRCIASLKCFYSFLVTEGVIDFTPTGQLVPEKTTQKLPQILSSKEVELLLEQPECTDMKGYRDHAMLELLYATGIRVSELISLNVTDINLSAGVIRCASKEKVRIIPLYPKAIRALSEYIEFIRPQMIGSPEEQSLFVNVSGDRMSRQGF